MLSFQTDLAREAYIHAGNIAGVTETVRQVGCAAVSVIDIETAAAAEALQKQVGRYVTVTFPDASAPPPDAPTDASADVVRAVETELAAMLPKNCASVLVIGLGNRFVTPDALGPKTAARIFVTRHIACFAPELAPSGMRSVSAFSPGVLGVSGLETVEVVRALARAAKPDAVICIDALAAAEASRITDTVQINDNGLLPGAGVGNRQRGLNKEALGIPVLAIGMPTVVPAAVIAEQAVLEIAARAGLGKQSEQLKSLAGDIVREGMGGMIVTPKDVDKLVTDASRRLAEGVNRALHGAQYETLASLLLH